MPTASFQARRGELQTYFDRTAVEAWTRLTSDAPVSGIRATVRAGREEMRAALLSWLPAEMPGLTLLDAGCGTGALAVEAARRGAAVTAVDVSPNLVRIAQDRAGPGLPIAFQVGDMLDPALGEHDHAVLMDSLIHYRAPDIARALAGLAARTRHSILFTFAPRTAALSAMHAIGRLFPRGDRAPAVEPVGELRLRHRLAADPGLSGWRVARGHRVARGFYISHALELVRG